jgi:hypothetical protein
MNRHSPLPLSAVSRSAQERSCSRTRSRSSLGFFLPLLIIVSTFYAQHSCAAQARAHNPSPAKIDHDLWITVFVHGIMSVKPHLNTNNFIRFMQDKIQNTFYEKTVIIMRDDPFFYQNQAMGPRGLHYIDPNVPTQPVNTSRTINTPSVVEACECALNADGRACHSCQAQAGIDTGKGSAAMAYLMDYMQKNAQTGQYNNRYYTFGWTGLLSPRQRYEDAVELFKALEIEVQKLTKQGTQPKIRVVGYSHGGNVCLNLGAAHQKAFPNSHLSIDELVLIGTPIQHDTDYLINDPIFKRVYNLYSMSDRVQKLDFFSTDRFFSGRKFIHRPGFKIPEKLTQIQLKVTRNKVNKNKANKNKKLADSSLEIAEPGISEYVLDFDARGIKTGKSPLLRNASPGHAELWFFGWTPQHYRADYPLYPLPTIALLPFITKNLDSQTSGDIIPRHLIIDIRPQHNIILFKDRKKPIIYKTVPFMEKAAFENLKNQLLSFAPSYYTKEDYETHTQYAIDQAITKYKHLYAPAGKKHRARTCKIDRKKTLATKKSRELK